MDVICMCIVAERDEEEIKASKCLDCGKTINK